MDDFFDLLKSPQGRELIEGSSKQLGLNKADATSALASAVPIILGAMKNNAASPNKGSGLLDAILGDHANSSLLDNIGSILGSGNGGSMSTVFDEGRKILGHLFGGQEEQAAHAISKTSGIDMNQAFNLLKMAAPLLMAYIGRKASQSKINDPNSLSGLLDNVLGGESEVHSTIASKIQDFENNSDTTDTIGEFISDAVKKSGVIGKLFNDLLK